MNPSAWPLFGEALALSSAIFWAVAVILFKRSGESLAPFTLNFVKTSIAALLMAPTVLIVHGWNGPGLLAHEWAVLAISGFVGIGVADILYLDSLKRIGASYTGIAATLFSPSVVLLSILFLGESLTLAQAFGLILVVAGVGLVSYRSSLPNVDPRQLRRGMLLAAGAVFLMATGIVMAKRIIETAPLMWVIEIRILAGVAGMALIAAVRGRLRTVAAELRAPHQWGTIILASVIGTWLAMLTFIGGYRYTDASIASVLNETAAIFIVVLAAWFLDERLTRRKLLGVVLAFVGVTAMLAGF